MIVSPENTSRTKPLDPIQDKPLLKEKILRIAKVFFLMALGIAFFATNPNIFAMTFVVVIFYENFTNCPGSVATANKKIFQIPKEKPLLFSVTVIAASILSLPIAWAVGSILYASHLASNLSPKIIPDEKSQKPA